MAINWFDVTVLLSVTVVIILLVIVAIYFWRIYGGNFPSRGESMAIAVISIIVAILLVIIVVWVLFRLFQDENPDNKHCPSGYKDVVAPIPSVATTSALNPPPEQVPLVRSQQAPYTQQYSQNIQPPQQAPYTQQYSQNIQPSQQYPPQPQLSQIPQAQIPQAQIPQAQIPQAQQYPQVLQPSQLPQQAPFTRQIPQTRSYPQVITQQVQNPSQQIRGSTLSG